MGNVPHKEMGAGIAASPHCAERRIRQISGPDSKEPISDLRLTSSGVAFHRSAPSRGGALRPYEMRWPEGLAFLSRRPA
jgi:hypothetical protein